MNKLDLKIEPVTHITMSQKSYNKSFIPNLNCRIVTGLTRSVSIEKLFTECGWTTLTNRRIQQKMTFMYRVSNQLVPSYISDIIPPLVSVVSNYPLRNNSNYSVPYTRTEVSRRSCVPSSVSLGIISMKMFVTPVQSIHLKTMLSLYIPIYKLFHHIILRVIESYQLYIHA